MNFKEAAAGMRFDAVPGLTGSSLCPKPNPQTKWIRLDIE